MLRRRKRALVTGILAVLVPVTIGVAAGLDDDRRPGPSVVSSPSEKDQLDGEFRSSERMRKLMNAADDLRRRVEQLATERKEFRRRIEAQLSPAAGAGDRSIAQVEAALEEIERELVRTLRAQRETCNEFPVPFKPSYLPSGFSSELKRGSASDGPGHKMDYPDALGYFITPDYSYIDIYARSGRHVWSPNNPSTISVGDGTGKIGRIEGGYSVAFRWNECGYLMLTYSIEREELQKVAEGLVDR